MRRRHQLSTTDVLQAGQPPHMITTRGCTLSNEHTSLESLSDKIINRVKNIDAPTRRTRKGAERKGAKGKGAEGKGNKGRGRERKRVRKTGSTESKVVGSIRRLGEYARA